MARDGGIEIRLGDDMNGYLAEETVSTVVTRLFPDYREDTRLLPRNRPTDFQVARMTEHEPASRLFQRPKTGAQVICPHCGAPHAAPPGMDELFAFVCHHCGNVRKCRVPSSGLPSAFTRPLPRLDISPNIRHRLYTLRGGSCQDTGPQAGLTDFRTT